MVIRTYNILEFFDNFSIVERLFRLHQYCLIFCGIFPTYAYHLDYLFISEIIVY